VHRFQRQRYIYSNECSRLVKRRFMLLHVDLEIASRFLFISDSH
jgi:hypothetical protein